MLKDGSYCTIKELAVAEKVEASSFFRVTWLTPLASDSVDAILDGQQPVGMALPGHMEVGRRMRW